MEEAVILYDPKFKDYWYNEQLVKDLPLLISQLLEKHITVTIKEDEVYGR